MKKIIFLIQLIFVWKANATSCVFDQNQSQYIEGLEKVKNHNLWNSYPLSNRFVIAEAEDNKRGMYILNSNELELSKSGIPYEACPNNKTVFKIGNNFRAEPFIPHLYCSSNDDSGCSSMPNLSQFQKNTGLNIGIQLQSISLVSKDKFLCSSNFVI